MALRRHQPALRRHAARRRGRWRSRSMSGPRSRRRPPDRGGVPGARSRWNRPRNGTRYCTRARHAVPPRVSARLKEQRLGTCRARVNRGQDAGQECEPESGHFRWKSYARHAGIERRLRDLAAAVQEISQVARIRLGPEWPYAAVTSETDTWIVNVETGALRHLAANTNSVGARRGPTSTSPALRGRPTRPVQCCSECEALAGRRNGCSTGRSVAEICGPGRTGGPWSVRGMSRLDSRLVDGLRGG